MMEVVRCKIKETAIKNAGKKLSELFLNHQHVPVLFLSSGGSALELLDEIDTVCLPYDLVVGVLDERVGIEPRNSNSAQFKATSFFARLQKRGVPFIDLEGKTSARKVIITQGVGADGHTAGIFPFGENPQRFQELFENEKVLLVRYNAGDKTEYPERVTVTMPFLRKVDHSVVYMVGEEKRDALERVLAEDGALHETPARIAREMRDVTIFTDIQERV
ncbi:MAG: 6-phosphogluconolactonase [Candidatus Wildermuthbacteria bacterium]|nr:6-phosphogluconolactonase [Candidatus Wildermuthbacteria bacterium]